MYPKCAASIPSAAIQDALRLLLAHGPSAPALPNCLLPDAALQPDNVPTQAPLRLRLSDVRFSDHSTAARMSLGARTAQRPDAAVCDMRATD
jgi:hypothetical protein